jgi:hypothetical protein
MIFCVLLRSIRMSSVPALFSWNVCGHAALVYGAYVVLRAGQGTILNLSNHTYTAIRAGKSSAALQVLQWGAERGV